MKKPLVSILIPTKNAALTLGPLLASIQAQTYLHIEIIVVDNFSTDITADIAAEYGVVPILQGPERHAQRRAAAAAATGDVLFFVDADMKLEVGLVAECVSLLADGADAVIIHEMPHGAANFWTRVKCLERSLYAGDDQIEAARVFARSAYDRVGGFSDTMISCEDWDLTDRLRQSGAIISRTKAGLWHDEGYVTLQNIWQKKRYYGGKARAFTLANGRGTLISRVYFFRASFWHNLPRIFQQPHMGLALCFFLGWELIAGGVGYLFFKHSQTQ